MQKEFIIGERMSGLDQAKEIFMTLSSNHFWGNVAVQRYRGEQHESTVRWTRNRPTVRVSIPVSDIDTAILDTRFESIMGDWTITENPHLLVVPASSEASTSMLRKNIEPLISNENNHISMEELKSISLPGDPIQIRIFEESFFINSADNTGEYLVGSAPVIIYPGDTVITTTTSIIIKSRKPGGYRCIIEEAD